MLNPFSVEPFGPISVKLKVGNQLTQKCKDGVLFLIATVPNQLSNLSINIPNLTISAINTNIALVNIPMPPNNINSTINVI
jgi:hypothetical protein